MLRPIPIVIVLQIAAATAFGAGPAYRASALAVRDGENRITAMVKVERLNAEGKVAAVLSNPTITLQDGQKGYVTITRGGSDDEEAETIELEVIKPIGSRWAIVIVVLKRSDRIVWAWAETVTVRDVGSDQ